MVNEHLDVVLEDDGKTHVYIDGQQFLQCMRLLLTFPLTKDIGEVSPIDDAKEKYGTVYEGFPSGFLSWKRSERPRPPARPNVIKLRYLFGLRS
nr:hypothetical protein [Candidatus Sigynarchaeum springense]